MRMNSLSPLASPLPMGAAAEPFTGFTGDRRRLLFSSSDRWEVESLVAGVMRSHRLSVTGEHERLRARMHHAALGEVALSRLSYGASVQIDPDPLDAFFLIQMPLAGGAQIANGAQRIESSPELASVLNPDDEIHMRWLSAPWSPRWAVNSTSRCASNSAFAGATADPGWACCPI